MLINSLFCKVVLTLRGRNCFNKAVKNAYKIGNYIKAKKFYGEVRNMN